MEQPNNTTIEQPGNAPKYVPPFMVADAFRVEFLDDAFCTRFFLDLSHGRVAHCPECKKDLTDDFRERRYYALQKFTCNNCKKRVSAKKGTILERSHLTTRQYILLALFLEGEYSSTDIARFVGISDESVRQWRNKLNAK